MSSEARCERSTLTRPQSPHWAEILHHVESQIAGRRQIRGSGPSSPEGTASALARAHSRLLVALEHPKAIDDMSSQLATEAVELILAVARLWRTFGTRAEDQRGALVDQLRQRLSSHEDAVLAGEVTYRVWSEQAEDPAARMRQALTRLSRDASTSDRDLMSLGIAAVDLAALLVQLAANATASGEIGEAPEPRSIPLELTLAEVTANLAPRQRKGELLVDDRRDIVAHHLAAGLRVRAPQEALKGPDEVSADPGTSPTAIDRLRKAWLQLATNEYVAVQALGAQLDTPTDNHRTETLPATIADAATNVICGARLIGRPGAFRHHQAWRQQATALTYALEAYIAGLRGHAPSLAQAHHITLTRLVRATVAITLIDLNRTDISPTDQEPQA